VSANSYLMLGMVTFLLLHIASGVHEIRSTAINKLGIMFYRIVISVASTFSVYALVLAFGMRPFDICWQVSPHTALIPYLLVPISLFLLILQFFPKDRPCLTRQPAGWSIIVWSAAHLVANGESGSVMLFAGFLVYGVLVIMLRERKSRLGDETAAHGAKHCAPHVPFAIWPSGQVKLLSAALLITIVLRYLVLEGHSWIIGVSPYPLMFIS